MYTIPLIFIWLIIVILLCVIIRYRLFFASLEFGLIIIRYRHFLPYFNLYEISICLSSLSRRSFNLVFRYQYMLRMRFKLKKKPTKILFRTFSMHTYFLTHASFQFAYVFFRKRREEKKKCTRMRLHRVFQDFP